MERIGVSQAAEYRSEDGIVNFCTDILHVTPTAYQEDILRAFVREKRVAARGPHGLGKSALASWIINWFIGCFDEDVKVVTTASAWRQLEKFLWPEVRKWALKADWERLGVRVREGKELLSLSLRIGTREAFAAASDNPQLMEGAHASTVAYIFDEAKAIPEDTWDAAEGAFSQEGLAGKEAYALAISTPGEPVGRFYDIHAKKPGLHDWWTRHVTLQEAIDAGQISAVWAENRRIQWGDDSEVYKRRVLGEFASSAQDSVVPLEWVEAANKRWQEVQDRGVDYFWDEEAKENASLAIGCDPARSGADKTAIVRIMDWYVPNVTFIAKRDTMQITGRLMNMSGKGRIPIGVDVIGIGAGIVDRLREQVDDVVGMNSSHASDFTDMSGELQFLNLRSALWWMLREHLDPQNEDQLDLLALPPDEKLTGDLVTPRWSETSRGVIKVESKDDIRRRLKRSTDAADALMIAWYVLNIGNTHGMWL
jgi:hypothetical protein